MNIYVFTAHGTPVSEPAVGYVNPDGTYTVDNLPASSTGYIVCAWTAEELTATPADWVSTCYGGRTWDGDEPTPPRGDPKGRAELRLSSAHDIGVTVRLELPSIGSLVRIFELEGNPAHRRVDLRIQDRVDRLQPLEQSSHSLLRIAVMGRASYPSVPSRLAGRCGPLASSPAQLVPGPHLVAQPADAEELVRRVPPLHGPVLAIGWEAIAVVRTTGARPPRSGSSRRSGRRQG